MKELVQLATSADDVAAALDELKRRGVTNPAEFSSLPVSRIRETLEWFDAQNGRVGVGVLVAELRAGGRKIVAARGSLVAEQREYGQRIVMWLNENFPEFTQRSGNPHPGAVAAVIDLHYKHGKGALTRGKHGEDVRRGVKAFDEKWLSEGSG
jgi:hypothetical protein